MKYAGIITAAGLSTRMGEFKPLLPLNGLPMAYHTVLSMKNAGIGPICVVTGTHGEELRTALAGLDVIFAENTDPAGTDMLASVRLGLEIAADSDGFFLLPVDMPLIAPAVFRKVQDTAEKTGADYVVPTVNGKSAHPPLVGRACYDAVRDFSGDGGLRAALADFPRTTVEAGDKAMNRDADTPEDFNAVQKTAAERLGLSDARCEELWSAAQTPDKVREHCRLVAGLAERLADHLVAAGFGLDILLCRSGGLLHDVLRTEHHHPDAGAAFLRRHGYLRLASITEKHMSFSRQRPSWSEELVVCLADKLIRNDGLMTPQQRYARALERFPVSTERGRKVRQDCLAAEKWLARYEAETGDRLFGEEK